MTCLTVGEGHIAVRVALQATATELEHFATVTKQKLGVKKTLGFEAPSN